ncbi:MAG: CoA-transferase subunit beta [Gammaproteobacteria bacterium]
MNTPNYTIAELMVCAIAAEIRDGEYLAQGIATHLPTCAYFLARRTHAPHCYFLYSVGCTVSTRQGPLSLLDMEPLALDTPLRRVGYAEIVCDMLPRVGFAEFSRPAQVDRYGNTNNVVIGDYAQPKLRFPGVGGVSDFSPYESHRAFLYVPRHDRRTFVENLDFVSGVGHRPGETREQRAARGVTGHGTRRLVSNLGVFEFSSAGMTALSLHAGVSAAEVRAATGFEVEIAPDCPDTPAPSAEALRLIREEIDPSNARELEFLSGAPRLARIREMIAREAAPMQDPKP